MNNRRFVSVSSLLLAGWLGATFFYEVPSQRYPKLDKTPATAAIEDLIDGASSGPSAPVAPLAKSSEMLPQ